MKYHANKIAIECEATNRRMTELKNYGKDVSIEDVQR